MKSIWLGAALTACPLLWFFTLEYLRGRPTTSAGASFVLKWLSPIGTAVLGVLAFMYWRWAHG